MAYEIPALENDAGSIGDYIDALRRRSVSATIIFAAIMILGILIVVLLPNRYTSTATILIEQPEVPPGLVPTTVTTMAAQQLQYITQRVMTRTNLAGIIEKFDLYQDEREYMPTLMLVEDAKEDMSIDLVDIQTANQAGQTMTSTIAFTLSYEHESPKRAQAVANELVSLYLDENVRTRTIQTAETREFIQQEVDALDEEVKQIEAEIAAYKSENEGSTPELANVNLQMMQRIDSELLQIRGALGAIEESRIMLQSQLSQVSRMSPSLLADGRTVVSPEDQLKALQTERARLAGRYSDDHPDVLRAEREIKGLKAQLGITDDLDVSGDAGLMDAETELSVLRERYGDEHPEVKQQERVVSALRQDLEGSASLRSTATQSTVTPDNPAYIQLDTQLRSLDVEERQLLDQQEQLKRKLDEYETKLLRSSSVERELRGMQRRLSTATDQYLMARERLFAARMGQSLETQSKGERFTLVEPADQPLIPSSPNRPVLLALFTVIALAAGLGWPQVAAGMQGAVRGAKGVQRIFGAPPIAEIPLIVTQKDRQRVRRIRWFVLLMIPVVVILLLTAVHLFVKPLDVFWYVTLRRMGLGV